jgi:hypothetical protein
LCSGRIVGKQEVIWSVKACSIKVSRNQIIGKLPASTLSLGKLPKSDFAGTTKGGFPIACDIGAIVRRGEICPALSVLPVCRAPRVLVDFYRLTSRKRSGSRIIAHHECVDMDLVATTFGNVAPMRSRVLRFSSRHFIVKLFGLVFCISALAQDRVVPRSGFSIGLGGSYSSPR